ncbi:MAG: hypothetical protein ACK52P_16205 [Alphaproteobacteria bacterium]|jgi:hypothetical protein
MTLASPLVAAVGLGVVATALAVAAPGPVAHLSDRIGVAGATTSIACAMGSLNCLDATKAEAERRLPELRRGLGELDTGLRSVAAEEARQRGLLDTNLSLQASLRPRVMEMLLSNATHMEWERVRYSRDEALTQPELLTQEEAQFRRALDEVLPARRAQLVRLRQDAVLAQNELLLRLSMIEADRALAKSNRSLSRARQLVSEADASIRQADAVTATLTGAVRSTRELEAALRASAAATVARPGFDVAAWARSGTAAR